MKFCPFILLVWGLGLARLSHSIVVTKEDQVYNIDHCEGNTTSAGGDFAMEDCSYIFPTMELNSETREISYNFSCTVEHDITIKIVKQESKDEERDTVQIPKQKLIETYFKVDRESQPEQFGELFEFLKLKSDHGSYRAQLDQKGLPQILRRQVSRRHKARIDDVGESNTMYNVYLEFPKLREPGKAPAQTII